MPQRYRPNLNIQALGYGIKSYAYLPAFSNPLFNVFGRMGYVPLRAWQITQNAEWVNPSLMVIGLPGVQAGQAVGQPLLDTRKGVNGL